METINVYSVYLCVCVCVCMVVRRHEHQPVSEHENDVRCWMTVRHEMGSNSEQVQ